MEKFMGNFVGNFPGEVYDAPFCNVFSREFLWGDFWTQVRHKLGAGAPQVGHRSATRCWLNTLTYGQRKLN